MGVCVGDITAHLGSEASGNGFLINQSCWLQVLAVIRWLDKGFLSSRLLAFLPAFYWEMEGYSITLGQVGCVWGDCKSKCHYLSTPFPLPQTRSPPLSLFPKHSSESQRIYWKIEWDQHDWAGEVWWWWMGMGRWGALAPLPLPFQVPLIHTDQSSNTAMLHAWDLLYWNHDWAKLSYETLRFSPKRENIAVKGKKTSMW